MPLIARHALTLASSCLVLLSGCSITQVDTYAAQDGRLSEAALGSLEDQKRMEIVMTAMTTLGAPYRWGGHDTKKGFDCSGLVYYAYTKNGVDKGVMPRVTTDLANNSKPIKRHELKPGDLVFFNTLGRRYSHVGIYVGKGRFINAPSKGKRVRIDSLESPYYKKRYTGARRLELIETAAVAGYNQAKG